MSPLSEQDIRRGSDRDPAQVAQERVAELRVRVHGFVDAVLR